MLSFNRAQVQMAGGKNNNEQIVIDDEQQIPNHKNFESNVANLATVSQFNPSRFDSSGTRRLQSGAAIDITG